MPHANSEKIVGFIGGMDIYVIRNFLIGYLEGALYVDPSVKVMVDFTHSFTDEAAGRERAEAQYSWGTDIIFAAAGEAGLGQVEAAKEWERYAIGVDYDQGKSFAQSDSVKANLILTSVILRIDNTLLQSVEKHLAGTLPYGQAEAWGVAHEAIGLADNTFYQRNVPSAIRSEMNRITTLISNGTIRVGNVYTVSETELWQLVENVAP
jgi:basic membrane protein A and related proteins